MEKTLAKISEQPKIELFSMNILQLKQLLLSRNHFDTIKGYEQYMCYHLLKNFMKKLETCKKYSRIRVDSYFLLIEQVFNEMDMKNQKFIVRSFTNFIKDLLNSFVFSSNSDEYTIQTKKILTNSLFEMNLSSDIDLLKTDDFPDGLESILKKNSDRYEIKNHEITSISRIGSLISLFFLNAHKDKTYCGHTLHYLDVKLKKLIQENNLLEVEKQIAHLNNSRFLQRFILDEVTSSPSTENIDSRRKEMIINIKYLISNHDTPIMNQKTLFIILLNNLNKMNFRTDRDLKIYTRILKDDLQIDVEKCIKTNLPAIISNISLQNEPIFSMIDRNIIENYKNYTNMPKSEQNPLNSFKNQTQNRINGNLDRDIPKKFSSMMEKKRAHLRKEIANTRCDLSISRPTMFGSNRIYKIAHNLNNMMIKENEHARIECFKRNHKVKKYCFKTLRTLFHLSPKNTSKTLISLLPCANIDVEMLKLIQSMLLNSKSRNLFPRSVLRNLSEKILFFTIDEDCLKQQLITKEQSSTLENYKEKIHEIEQEKYLTLSYLLKAYKHNDENINTFELNDIVAKNHLIDQTIEKFANINIARTSEWINTKKIFHILESTDENDIDKRNINVFVHKISLTGLFEWAESDTDAKLHLIRNSLKHSQKGFLNGKIGSETIISILESENVTDLHLIKFMMAIIHHGYRNLIVYKKIFFKCIDIIARSRIQYENMQIESIDLKNKHKKYISRAFLLLKEYKKCLTGKFYLCVSEIFGLSDSNIRWGETEQNIVRDLFISF